MGPELGLTSRLLRGIDPSSSDTSRCRPPRDLVRKWRGGALAALLAASLVGPATARAAAPSVAITSSPSGSVSAKGAGTAASASRTVGARPAPAAIAAPVSAPTAAPASAPRAAPVSAPTAAPAAAPAPTGAVLWNGDLSTGDLSQWTVQAPNGGQVNAVPNPHPDPNFSGPFAGQFGISDLNTNAQGHPDGQLIDGSYKLTPGADFYVGFSVYLPPSFPQHICWNSAGRFFGPCWMQLMEIYGAPYGGPSPISLGIVGATYTAGHPNQFVFNAPYHSITSTFSGAAWRSPPMATSPTGWQSFVWHVYLSTCGGTTACTGGQLPGFVELWMNGVQQHFYDGSTRIDYATLTRSNYCAPGLATFCGYDALFMQQYRGQYPAYGTGYTGGGAPYSPVLSNNGTVTDYIADAKIGTTYAAVAPH